MKKNGFTLVELMVVIVIIGVLAAVSLPRFGEAGDKSRVAEAPQILSAIAAGQEAHRIAMGRFLVLVPSETWVSHDDCTVDPRHNCEHCNWRRAMPQVPQSNVFSFSADVTPVNEEEFDFNAVPTFIARATLRRDLTRAQTGAELTINEAGARGARGATSDDLRRLVPTFFQ